jgi:hypothetical protein
MSDRCDLLVDMSIRRHIRGIGRLAAVAGAYWIGQAAQRRWGARDDEVEARLPGDEIVGQAQYESTRAISIDAPADQVWPWLVQLGQGRGGFYSYDHLENLFGLDIHSATTVEDQWQNLAVGDMVSLGQGAKLEARVVEPGRALVLANPAEAPDSGPLRFDASWAFILEPVGDKACRLIERERYASANPVMKPIFHAVGWVSAVMSTKMLRTIRDRSQTVA